VDPNLEILIFLVMALAVFVFATSDLALDLLHVSPSALPRWQASITQMMVRAYEAEAAKGRSPQRWFRRGLDGLMLAGALALPLILWVARKGLDAGKVNFCVIFELLCLAWLVYLVRRPRAGSEQVVGAPAQPRRKSNRRNRRR
jgi:hypothetical protein